MANETSSEQGNFTRIRGLPLLIGIIAVGMGVPAYYMWSVPRLKARADDIRAAAPTDAVGRLAEWFRFGQPNIHNALILARFSAEQPWYVTHVISGQSADEPAQIWGFDFTDLSPDVLRVEDTTVYLEFPAPTLLERGVLVGDKALGVPVYDSAELLKDPCAMARGRLERYLERTRSALVRDIPGADLVVRIGG
ncbi:MAG: hypothetical protein ACI80N_001494 [Gammaproteobacteria bacterium]|jgi:hypothetical protein